MDDLPLWQIHMFTEKLNEEFSESENGEPGGSDNSGPGADTGSSGEALSELGHRVRRRQMPA